MAENETTQLNPDDLAALSSEQRATLRHHIYYERLRRSEYGSGPDFTFDVYMSRFGRMWPQSTPEEVQTQWAELTEIMATPDTAPGGQAPDGISSIDQQVLSELNRQYVTDVVHPTSGATSEVRDAHGTLLATITYDANMRAIVTPTASAGQVLIQSSDGTIRFEGSRPGSAAEFRLPAAVTNSGAHVIINPEAAPDVRVVARGSHTAVNQVSYQSGSWNLDVQDHNGATEAQITGPLQNPEVSRAFGGASVEGALGVMRVGGAGAMRVNLGTSREQPVVVRADGEGVFFDGNSGRVARVERVDEPQVAVAPAPPRPVVPAPAVAVAPPAAPTVAVVPPLRPTDDVSPVPPAGPAPAAPALPSLFARATTTFTGAMDTLAGWRDAARARAGEEEWRRGEEGSFGGVPDPDAPAVAVTPAPPAAGTTPVGGAPVTPTVHRIGPIDATMGGRFAAELPAPVVTAERTAVTPPAVVATPAPAGTVPSPFTVAGGGALPNPVAPAAVAPAVPVTPPVVVNTPAPAGTIPSPFTVAGGGALPNPADPAATAQVPPVALTFMPPPLPLPVAGPAPAVPPIPLTQPEPAVVVTPPPAAQTSGPRGNSVTPPAVPPVPVAPAVVVPVVPAPAAVPVPPRNPAELAVALPRTSSGGRVEGYGFGGTGHVARGCGSSGTSHNNQFASDCATFMHTSGMSADSTYNLTHGSNLYVSLSESALAGAGRTIRMNGPGAVRVTLDEQTLAGVQSVRTGVPSQTERGRSFTEIVTREGRVLRIEDTGGRTVELAVTPPGGAGVPTGHTDTRQSMQVSYTVTARALEEARTREVARVSGATVTGVSGGAVGVNPDQPVAPSVGGVVIPPTGAGVRLP